MVSFGMVMADVFRNGAAEGVFPDRHDMIKAFGFYAEDEPFGISIEIGRERRQSYGLDAAAFHNLVKRQGIFRIAVMDKIAGVFEFPAGDVSGGLSHPFAGGVGGNAADDDFAGTGMDEKEHKISNQPEFRPDFRGEEIGGPEAFLMEADEFGPGHAAAFALAGRIEAVAFQHIGD